MKYTTKMKLALAVLCAAQLVAVAPASADLVVNAGDLGTLNSGFTLLSGTTAGKPNNAATYTNVNNASTTAWDRGEDVYQFTLSKPAYLYMTDTLEPEPPLTGFGTPDHDYFLLNTLTTADADNTSAYFVNASPKKKEATSLAFVQNSVGPSTPGSAGNSGIFRSTGPTATNPNNPTNLTGLYPAGTYYLSVDTKGAANAFQREGAYSAKFNVRYLDELITPNARPTRPVTNAEVNEPTKSITGSFGPGEVKWFEFNYTGQQITVDTNGTLIGESNADTFLALYNSSGAVVNFNDDVGQNTSDPNSAGLPFGWSRVNIAAGSIPNGKYYLAFSEYKGVVNPGFDYQKYSENGPPTGNSSSYVINGLGGFLPGDADLDDDVDFSDLLTLAKNYNQTSGKTYSTGDADTDGDVDFADLLLLAKNYGKTYSGPVDLSAFSAELQHDWVLAQSLVPEPTTLSLLGVAGLAVVRRRR